MQNVALFFGYVFILLILILVGVALYLDYYPE